MKKIKLNNTYFLILRYLVAISLLYYLIYKIGGISNIIEIVSNTTVYFLYITIIIIVTRFFLLAFNLWILLNGLTNIKYFHFIKYYSKSFFLGLIIPGQIGDASIAYILKKNKIPYSKGGLAYTIDKFISIFTMVVISSIGALLLLPNLNIIWFILAFAIILFTLAVGIFVFYKLSLRGKLFNRFKTGIYQTIIAFKEYKKKWYLILINFLITIINWLLISCIFFFTFLSLNEKLPWPEVGIIPVLSTIIGYIPISIAGIGTIEYVAIKLFTLIGAEKQIVLSAYLLIRIFMYLSSGFMLLIFSFNYIKNKSYSTSCK